MKAEILCVGSEILLGDIVNTNAQYISKNLAKLGIEVYHQTVVGDNESRLLDEIDKAFKSCDLIITTGGLGPTKDDLTKETICRFFNEDLILHEDSLENITKILNGLNIKLSDSNKKQALFPKIAKIFKNNNGTAPGCAICKDGKIAIILPGPPYEMKPMFEECVIPYLRQFSKSTLHSKCLKITGISESEVNDLLKNLLDNKNPTVAPYAKQGEVTIRITAKSTSKESSLKLIEPIENEITQILKDKIYLVSEDEDTSLEETILNLLLSKKLTISIAESCTGGLLAGRFINAPGSSKCFSEGFITYSNESKIKRLNVKKETLDKYTAVSCETAKEMAEGVAKTCNTNIGISTTGVAGPYPSYGKPVGLVYIGLYINGKTLVKELNLYGNRDIIRNLAVSKALDFLRKELLIY